MKGFTSSPMLRRRLGIVASTAAIASLVLPAAAASAGRHASKPGTCLTGAQLSAATKAAWPNPTVSPVSRRVRSYAPTCRRRAAPRSLYRTKRWMDPVSRSWAKTASVVIVSRRCPESERRRSTERADSMFSSCSRVQRCTSSSTTVEHQR